ncbi:MAG: hypothetical protein RLZZ308_695 [Candidatus Parcubacteria bacterium]
MCIIYRVIHGILLNMQFVIDMGFFLLYLIFFLLLCIWMWRFWMMYINQKHLNAIDWLMLEIKLPREITKSPYATEVAIACLMQSGGISDKYARNFRGNLPAYSSLEIASTEGVIHFYVRIQKKFRALVEANFYSQYPGIEIVEADDYTSKIRYHHLSKDVSIWGGGFPLSKTWTPINEKTGKPYSKKGNKEPSDKGDECQMPADFLPLKTYVDYGLDKETKEEFKIDPLATLLEMMGGLGKGEHMWYQIILQDEGGVYNDKKFPKFFVNEGTHEHMSLSGMAETFKKQLRTSKYILEGDKVEDEYGGLKTITKKLADGTESVEDIIYKKAKTVPKKDLDFTMEERAQVEAVNKKLSKPVMLGLIRLIYVAKKENFNGQQIQNILAFGKPFAGVNSFGLSPSDPYSYPWQNFRGRRTPWRGEEMFESYVEREAFFPHIKARDSLDKWEDMFFWSSTMKQRKLFRMIYEVLMHPFDHPHPSDVSAYNLEEIATLWHLPGATVATPTLPRIDSIKGVAPANLPL